MRLIKTKYGKVIYFFYYLLVKPFKNIYKHISNASKKPRIVLNISLLITLVILFSRGFKNIFSLAFVEPDFKNKFFLAMCVISLVIYIWKYTSPKFGEGWKGDYAKLIKKIDEKGENL